MSGGDTEAVPFGSRKDFGFIGTDSGVPGTVLQIDGVDYRLNDGEALLRDDTYPHEVWNHANAVRVALLLDVRRADLPP